MAHNLLATFLEEAEELVTDIEQCALALSPEHAPAETVNRLFRAFHTIKGASAMCGLDNIAEFTHNVESVLERVRAGAIPISARLVELTLKASDHIRALLSEAQGGEGASAGAAEPLTAEFAGYLNLAPQPGGDRDRNGARIEPSRGAERSWRIRFRPHRALLANGCDPVALLNELRKLGACEVTAHTEEIPPLDALEADRCYLWWSITLRGACDENAIRDVFIFVEDESILEIEAVAADTPAVEPPACPTAARGEPGPVPVPQASRVREPARVAKEATVRVPAERLDRLVNLVGEFVMNHSCLAQAASQTTASELTNSIQVLERLVGELRDNVLGIRMLPIGSLFGRFQRLVHDLSAELGKEADLITEGAETELDKSILDRLSEPLVHCLRNCLDHGVEPAEERLRKGKARRATIRLCAEHVGSNVVISIQDDGRGIDRNAVRAKAVEKQLIAPEASLSDRDILNLLLLPGFTTAREVTNVSGRGVGMDAVKRQIDALRGSLALVSTEGEGTRVSLTLPLTLAIIEGLLVKIGAAQFIIPMAAVTENVELHRVDRARHNGRNLHAVRGELVPYVDLRTMFTIDGERPAIEKVVVVQHEGERVGLVVDRVVGSHQTVIQSLGRFFRDIEVVSGATIMGDGRVALIIDVAAIVRRANRRRETEPTGASPGTDLLVA